MVDRCYRYSGCVNHKLPGKLLWETLSKCWDGSPLSTFCLRYLKDMCAKVLAVSSSTHLLASSIRAQVYDSFREPWTIPCCNYNCPFSFNVGVDSRNRWSFMSKSRNRFINNSIYFSYFISLFLLNLENIFESQYGFDFEPQLYSKFQEH